LNDPKPLKLEEALKEIRENVKELRRKLGLRVSLSRVLAVLSDYPCMARCLAELKPRSRDLVDHYYLERHEFVRRLLLDSLRLRLLEEGFQIPIKAENHSESGTGDIDLEYNHLGVAVSVDSFRIRLEVKGGVRFPISQLLRYLLDANAVTLCLAGKGEAVTITRSEAKPLIEHLLKIVSAKLSLLIKGDETRIPGPWCSGCPIECEHARPQKNHRPNLNDEFVAPLGNWNKAIEQAVEQVVGLIKKVENTRKKLEQKSTLAR